MADLEGLPFEITHLGNLKDAGIPLPTDEESVPPIATDGTLVHVDDGRLRLVIFQESRPPRVIQPTWAQDLRIDAAIYEPENRYLAIRIYLNIRICQLDSDRDQWEHQAPLFISYDADSLVGFWKWLSPSTLALYLYEKIVKCTLTGGFIVPVVLPLGLHSSSLPDIVANAAEDIIVIIQHFHQRFRGNQTGYACVPKRLLGGNLIWVTEWGVFDGKTSFIMSSTHYVVATSDVIASKFMNEPFAGAKTQCVPVQVPQDSDQEPSLPRSICSPSPSTVAIVTSTAQIYIYETPVPDQIRCLAACLIPGVDNILASCGNGKQIICVTTHGDIVQLLVKTDYVNALKNSYPLVPSILLQNFTPSQRAIRSRMLWSLARIKVHHKILCNLKGQPAVELLDILVNDYAHNMDSSTIRLIQDLSSQAGELPSKLLITGVEVAWDQSLGGGGEATVYKARKGHRELAARRMNNNIENQLGAARREVLTHHFLSHRNILPLLGVFYHDGSLMAASPFIANKYSNSTSRYPNASSQHFIKTAVSSGIDDNVPEVAAKILLGATRAISYLHGRDPPVIHGDIHPENILVDEYGHAIVCDFGLSRIRHEVTRTATGIREGGRLRYLAPELTSASTDEFRTTTASDIFSLGMTFFSLITLNIPFAGRWDYDAMARINRGERPIHSAAETYFSKIPDLEACLLTLVEEMWSQNPEGRPISDAVLARLDEEFNRVGLAQSTDQGLYELLGVAQWA